MIDGVGVIRGLDDPDSAAESQEKCLLREVREMYALCC